MSYSIAIEKISNHPFLYPLHNPSQDVGRCIINGRIILYYKVIDERTVDILPFWQTSQNPDKLRF